MAFEFGECVVDPVARPLTWRGTAVPLTFNAFDVLVLLLTNRPSAVSKAEILDRVWPNTFVSDASLARTINEIRKAIGESGPSAEEGGWTSRHAQATPIEHRSRKESSVAPILVILPVAAPWLGSEIGRLSGFIDILFRVQTRVRRRR